MELSSGGGKKSHYTEAAGTKAQVNVSFFFFFFLRARKVDGEWNYGLREREGSVREEREVMAKRL